jgi:aspartate/methionine/tyrosine aminotransferase
MPSRRSDIDPFHVMEVMRAAEEREQAGGDVLHLEVGQPSTPATALVLAAAHAALDQDRLGYTGAKGLPELRDRIAGFYDQRYGVAVDPDRVVVTMGASGGFSLAFLSAFDVGDRVAVTAPGYPCYRNVLEAFGVEVVTVEVGPESGFVPTPDLLEAHGRLAGVVLASPANPTGTVLSGTQVADLATWAGDRAVRLVSDEIYHGITFGDPAPTVLATTDDAVVLQSFSKYWSMTGWRLGWVVAPADLLRAMERLAQNLFISAPTLSQRAALVAFDADALGEADRHVDRYRANRTIVLDGLAAMGCRTIAPADGAFYAYADVSHLGIPSPDLCATWLADLGVAVTPGIDFDPRRGGRFIRISFSESTEDVDEAMSRLVAWVQAGG